MFASLPWASRKAARPRLLTWVPSGRENLLKKQEVVGLLYRVSSSICARRLGELHRLITNSSIRRQTRNLIRYALEIKDPHLAQVVRRVKAGQMTIDRLRRE